MICKYYRRCSLHLLMSYIVNSVVLLRAESHLRFIIIDTYFIIISMGFFDSLKKLNFQKIGKTIGTVAKQAGNIASGYSNSSSEGTFGKIFSGLKNIDLGQVVQAGMDVYQQVANVRNAGQQAVVPPEALKTYENQQGFIEPNDSTMTQQKSTQKAIQAVEKATAVIQQQSVESIKQIQKMEKQIAKLQKKVEKYAQKQAIAGNGLASQSSIALNNQLKVLNQDLLGLTQNLIKDSNTHQKAIHGIKNTISSLSNSPSLTGGTIMFETNDDQLLMPTRIDQYSYRPTMSQFQRSQRQMYTRRPRIDMRSLQDSRQYQSEIQNSYLRKTKPIGKIRMSQGNQRSMYQRPGSYMRNLDLLGYQEPMDMQIQQIYQEPRYLGSRPMLRNNNRRPQRRNQQIVESYALN